MLLRGLSRLSALLALVLYLCVGLGDARPHPTSIIVERQAGCTFRAGAFDLVGRDTGEACRYTIKYGEAARWERSTGTVDQRKVDGSALPPACLQPGGNPTAGQQGMSEDCLYGVVYTPRGMKKDAKLPIFVWIHGGSYLYGSASAPGLDGSALAAKGNMVVVFLQYRLGVFGFLPPSASSPDPNLALNDVILGLKQIQRAAELGGWGQGKVVLGGQSSGASIIRALLSAPEAKGLFRGAILQSDPMTYGTAASSVTEQLRHLFYSQAPFESCASSTSCLRNIPADDILAAQAQFTAAAPSQIEGVPLVTPLRPTHNTPSLIVETTAQTSMSAYTLPSPPSSAPLLITTVANEAGSVTQSLFPQPIPADNNTYFSVLAMFVGPERAMTIVSSPEYALTGAKGEDEFRETFERLVTDGVWRCASRDFAAGWVRGGGKVWLGEWQRGSTYVTNAGGSYCAQQGRVCHEDDIFPTFDASPNADSATTALEDEVLARWTSFIHLLDPNPTSSRPGPGGAAGDFALPLPRPSTKSAGKPRLQDRIPLPREASEHCPAKHPSRAPPTPGPGGPAAGAGKGKESAPTDKAPAGAALPTWRLFNPELGTGTVYALGGGQVKACPAGFWGARAKYDWQVYG